MAAPGSKELDQNVLAAIHKLQYKRGISRRSYVVKVFWRQVDNVAGLRGDGQKGDERCGEEHGSCVEEQRFLSTDYSLETIPSCINHAIDFVCCIYALIYPID